jgi:hypothetical protein
MLGTICISKSGSVCLMKLVPPALDTCKLTIVISSWYSVPFSSMKWPSLSFPTNLGLKSVLSDVGIANSACFWYLPSISVYYSMSLPFQANFI